MFRTKSKEKVLVTGGSGLVGSAISIGDKPSSKKLDLMDYSSVDKYLRKNNFECVIHCAARVGGVKENSLYPADFFRDNMTMTMNLYEACRKNGVNKIVSVLSTCIFPDKATYPLTMDQMHNGEPHSSNYGYAFAKRMVHVLGRSYREQYGMNIVNVVPCNIYGPKDNFNLESSHVIPALIHKVFLAKQNYSNMEMWGTGNAQREFIYSKDIGRILEWCVENYNSEEPLIISPDEEISIKRIYKIIKKHLDYGGTVVYNNELEGQMRKPSDNSKFKEVLPNFEFTDIDTGIAETVKWFLENYNDCRR